MNRKINILHLEDDRSDAELVRSELDDAHLNCGYHYVGNKKDFTDALKNGDIDLILADFSLPQFDGLSALNIARQRFPDIPFIFVSGTIGEEIAVDMMQKGATDYVLKTKLARLVPAVKRAFDEAEEHVQRRKAEFALIDSELRYRQLFESNPVPMWVYDVDTLKFVDVNDTAVSHYGYSKNEFLSMTIKDIRPAEEVNHLMQNLSQKDLVLEKSGVWKHKKKDGTVMDMEITSHSIQQQPEGKNYRLVLAKDVTEQLKGQRLIKESLEEKEILLNEIHHRVKNSLQIITSLLTLQSRHYSDPKMLDMIKETQNRIMAMALVHQKLYRSKSFSDIGFRGYLENIISQIFRVFASESKSVKVNIDSEDMVVGLETAIPCGMIVNEIISNSVRHAFPGGRAGEIKISFGKSGPDKCRLVVSDNGVGMPGGVDVAAAKTLGLQLIETLAKQLDAKVEVRSKKGMEYRITFAPVTYRKRI